MFSFEELRVYQFALNFTDQVYTLCLKFPSNENFALSNQLRRAAASISLNIAEGSSRSKKDFCHFLDISRGSCYECVAIFHIAQKRSYISHEEFCQIYNTCNILCIMINKMKNALREV